ncbi:MAG: VWA domain-containing protein [Endomicrobiales bacterium]|nr:VWA domain-containing protein [Endomicrobiales bacterium]
MNFEHPYLLLMLFLVPALAAAYFYWFARKRKLMERFADARLLPKISTLDARLQHLKALLNVSAAFFIITALARPQFGTKIVEVRQSSSDIVIAVDVSKSMLAEDVKPSRLAKAKELLSALINQLGGNRVGIIAFAGTAFWQCPLTHDLSSAKMFLQIMDANLIPLGGTAIGDAIRLASKGLSKSAPGSKALVLLTDGEDHESAPEDAARQAAREGIKIYTIGFGSAAGEPIPVKDEQGNFSGYKKNKKGEVVMSKMDEVLLSRMASETGGRYFRSAGGAFDLMGLFSEIQGLDKKKSSSSSNRQLEDRYQYFLFFGLLSLAAGAFVPETKREKSVKE